MGIKLEKEIRKNRWRNDTAFSMKQSWSINLKMDIAYDKKIKMKSKNARLEKKNKKLVILKYTQNNNKPKPQLKY